MQSFRLICLFCIVKANTNPKYLPISMSNLEHFLFSFKDYFDHRILEDGTLTLRRNPDEDEVEEIHLPLGVAMNVVVAIPFLDINPIASQE